MNPAQLGALFAQHKFAVLGAGAAGAVLLGLRSRKKNGTGATSSAARPAGSLPAAAVVPGDQLAAAASGISSTDAYALQDELSKFLEQQHSTVTGQTGVTSVPPVASTLYAPTKSGNYVLYGDGSVTEVESDGSQLGLLGNQWDQIRAGGATPIATPQAHPGGAYYQTDSNLNRVGQPTT